MDLIQDYGSDGETNEVSIEKDSVVKVNVAPDVSIEDLQPKVSFENPSKSVVYYNPTFEALSAPVIGPENPYKNKRLANQNHLTGFVEEQGIDDTYFETQRRTFDNFGYAMDPINSDRFVGDVKKAAKNKGDSIIHLKTEEKKKRVKAFDTSNPLNYLGPWAGYEGDPEKIAIPEKDESEVNAQKEEGPKEKLEPGMEKTTFHGKSETDYQGRTYMFPPQDLDVDLTAEPGIKECYLPKRHIHTWSGHSAGVSAVKLFPKTAHLLLSAGMDSKVKLWDVYRERGCLRTYMGHLKAVRDICFSNDGKRFLTASYDKFIKLWDTETGQCLGRFTNKKIPYCVKFNPDEDKQDIFVAGCSDKKIIQWDIKSGQIVQEYDQHLGPVNTITFIDDNKRFITTSDDKTIRVWEWNIPVVVKYIAEPYMHSIPSVSVHPSGKWWLGQSLDNQIVVYGTGDRFRQHRKKIFKGHIVSGYACQVNSSPDGRFISSGDGDGNLWIWDWKTCKIVKKIKAHDKVLIGHEWHPHETSKVVTCSWDGLIKYWD